MGASGGLGGAAGVGIVAAAALLLASPLLLALAWGRGEAGRFARWGGWLALAASMGSMAAVAGCGPGIALVLAALPLPAWALIWWRRERVGRAGRDRAPPAARAGAGGASGGSGPRDAERDDVVEAGVKTGRRASWRGGRALGRVLVAIPLAATAALLLATQLSRLGGSMTVGIVIALGLAVLLWAPAALWAFSDPLLRRPAGGLTLVALASAVPLWLR